MQFSVVVVARQVSSQAGYLFSYSTLDGFVRYLALLSSPTEGLTLFVMRGQSQRSLRSAFILADDAWHRLVLNVDQISGRVELFVDSVLVLSDVSASVPLQIPLQVNPPPNFYPLMRE